jgi:putative hydrolase of the HAD superfamily
MFERKPNASCFKKVIVDNNLTTMETLFIDDSIQHINGANKLGIKTYLMKQNSSIIGLFPDIIQQVHH